MRKLHLLAVTVVALLALGTVAFAAQVNTYSVTGSTSPAKPGSKRQPVPIALKFAYTVGEQSGQRPSPVKRYTIGFSGVRSNGALFPKCTAAKINAAGGDRGCPKGSAVGSGTVVNAAGVTSNPADTSIPCNLRLTIYNSGRNQAALYLKGDPPQCAVSISQAIPARYVRFPGGTALQFDVPPSLLHPLTGIDNAVVKVQSSIRKLKAKGHGYYESIGCKGSKRPIVVTFQTEAGQRSTASTQARC